MDYDNFLVDCDGVIWNNGPIEGSFETLLSLKNQGKRVFFITNSSVRSVEIYKERIEGYNFPCNSEQIYSSARLAPMYIKEHFPDLKTAYVIGMSGLIDHLQRDGFKVFSRSDEINVEIELVVIGFDNRFIMDYILRAHNFIQRGAKVIATNSDKCFPMFNMIFPDTGSILEFFPDIDITVVGKPNTYIADTIIRNYQLDKSKTIIIGDNLDTDILLANRSGIDSALVLTGASSQKDIERAEAKPKFVLNRLSEITNHLI